MSDHTRRAAGLLVCAQILLAGGALRATEARMSDGTRIECRLEQVRLGPITGGDALVLVDQNESTIDDALTRLTRWGSPRLPGDRARMVLTDGSVLATNRPWSASGFFTADRSSVSLRRREAWIAAPREEVVSIHYEQSDDASMEELRDPGLDDTIRLRDGDVIRGAVEEIDRNGVAILAYGERIEAARERVAAVHFKPTLTVERPAVALVGLADGSLLRASALEIDSEGARIELGAKTEFSCPLDEVVFLQPLGRGTTYLSDLPVADYQHTPYFQLEWPLALDRDWDGQLLRCDGHSYAKGLAMHSASRAVYRLDQHQRFQADLGVADGPDASEPRGSVVFGVYLLRDGEFVRVLQSDVIRGGMRPTPIDIDVSGAAAMALVVDFADQADARDHALWLDARLLGAPVAVTR